jgi:hypothetical protein
MNPMHELNPHTTFLIDWLETQSELRHRDLKLAGEQLARWKIEEATQDNDPPEEAE